MKYDFDAVTDRRGTGSLKWDVGPEELPMWVADMDFPTAPAVREALQRRLDHGVFGYSVVPEEWAAAYRDWWQRRHGLHIETDWLIFCTGVVPAISSMVRKLTTPAEKVLLQTPVYNIFFNSIYNNGRNILESPLVYENGAYSIDWADLEAKLADPQTTLMILCNPHNPVGKLWDRETLARIGELCRAHHVTVISDEIHCDLTDPGHEYVPFAAASETCRDISVTCVAPTKTFNMAGLNTAAVFAADPVLRHKVWRGLNTDEVAEPNAFAVTAAVAAFREGEEWLDALRAYLAENKRRVRSFVADLTPELFVVPSEATYLLWVDCGRLCPDAAVFTDFLRRRTGLYVTEGGEYGAAGARFFRLNAACPRSTLEDGLNRLLAGVRLFREGRYFFDEARRRELGTGCCYEFQRGTFRGEAWREDSLYMSDDIFEGIGLWKPLSRALPRFNAYGPTVVTAEDWARLRSLLNENEAKWGPMLAELDPWVESSLRAGGAFSILGL